FFSNERGDSIQSAVPIADLNAGDSPLVIPHFADGYGWKTRVILVNNTEEELRGEVRFLSQGSLTDRPQPVEVGTANGAASVFEYHLLPKSFCEVQTDGAAENLSVGSVYVVPFPGSHVPAGYAILSDFIVDDAATALAGETRGNTFFETAVEGLQPANNLRF